MDDIPVTPSPVPNFPRSIPFLPIPFSIQNSRSSKGDGSASSWYRRRGHPCHRHRGRPWDHLRHRGRSCRVRQRRRSEAAPTEPSHGATPSPAPALAVSHEICAQDATSPVPVFTAAIATGAGSASISMDRAAAPGEPLPVASRASPVPRFEYVPSQQCGIFPLLQSCRRR
jgi:hypothetical protein